MDIEFLHRFRRFEEQFEDVVNDLYNVKTMYDQWLHDQAFISPADHIDTEVVDAAPSAGDLAAGEFRFGDGTGPNGNDEVFWSVDGSTVARVEADDVIT